MTTGATESVSLPRPRAASVPRLLRLRPLRIFQVLVVAVVLFTTLFPLYWLFTLSIKNKLEQLAFPPVWFPTSITFASYSAVLFDRHLTQYFVNGMIVSTTSALISVALGSAAAYGLNAGFRGANYVALGILAIRMVPPIVLAIPLFLIMRTYGLLDTYQGLIVVYIAFSLPYSTWLMRSFFLEVPSELEDAARIDGCSRLGALIRIILPLVAPGVAATSVFSFLLGWNEFLFALILTRTPASQTVPVVAATFISDQYVEWGNMAATGVIAVIPVVILMTVAQKHFVQGLTLGAVKG
jgi:multiple sugar transport system permease protein